MPPPITTFCFFFSYTFDATNTHPVTLEFKFFFFQTGHSKQTHKHTQPQNVEDESFSLAARLISFRSIFFYQKKIKHQLTRVGIPASTPFFHQHLEVQHDYIILSHRHLDPSCEPPPSTTFIFFIFLPVSQFSVWNQKKQPKVYSSPPTHTTSKHQKSTHGESTERKKKDREGKPAKVRKESMRGQNHCTKMGGKRERR